MFSERTLRLVGGGVRVSGLFCALAALLAALPELALSTGSACTSEIPEPSHVLRALGLDRKAALGSLRIAIGRPTTADEIERAADLLAHAVARQRRRT